MPALPNQPLTPDFFAQDTLTVARELLGCELLRLDTETGEPIRLKIVETEAYTQHDPACHAYKRTAGRAEILYDRPGLAYVYLIYGMYHCLNVVTEPKGQGGAVLFRALEPPAGSPYRTNGPGRLTKALGITKNRHNGLDMTAADSELALWGRGEDVLESQIVQTTRIGITQAVDWPWRFYLAENPWVSVKAKPPR